MAISKKLVNKAIERAKGKRSKKDIIKEYKDKGMSTEDISNKLKISKQYIYTTLHSIKSKSNTKSKKEMSLTEIGKRLDYHQREIKKLIIQQTEALSR